MLTKNVVLLGAAAVGKSALVQRFIHNTFDHLYYATIEDTYTRLVANGKNIIELHITDTSGDNAFASLHDAYIQSGDGFIVVYSTTDVDSFLYAREKLGRIRELRPGVPVLLVGTNTDVVDYREVPFIAASRLSNNFNATLMEVSAANTLEVNSVFRQMVKEMCPLPREDNTACLWKALVVTLISLAIASTVLVVLLLQ